MDKILENTTILNLLYHLKVYKITFYIYVFYWHLIHEIPKNITTRNIYELFYIDFLKVQEEDCKIIEMSENKLVTRCKNKCPILDLSLSIDLDTKISCKKISEGPCKCFLKKLNKRITFERNYEHIRPLKDDCEETITINKDPVK